MKLYADVASVRARQVLGDVLVLVVTWLVVRQAARVRRQLLDFRSAAERVESAGRNVVRGADAAGSALQDVPVVGGALSAPFGAVADAGRDLSAAGTDAGAAIEGLGLFVPLLLVGLVLGYVLFRYLPGRLAWMRETAEVARVLGTADGERLLAHRAVAGRPLRLLRQSVVDPGAALAHGDWAPLAAVELQELGLRRSPPDGHA
ncbi:hypothetical protein [Egicoccus sp. AB-alg6-2]|uniref:hypothetical protein n=1 Tax=Egicoccus sp. AB-alg6-2 TaxID=3242692 RepID=UPI00359D0E58